MESNDEISSISHHRVFCSLPQFESEDKDEIVEHVSTLFRPHQMDVRKSRSRLRMRLRHMKMGESRLTVASYGTAVSINAGLLEDFNLIQIPLSGQARISLGNTEHTVSPGRAAVQHPNAPLAMDWSEDCEMLILRISAARLDSHLAAFLGAPMTGKLSFQPSFAFNSIVGRTITRQLADLMSYMHEFDSSDLPPLLSANIENSLIGALLFLQPHDATDRLKLAVSDTEPKAIRLVREYLEAHASEPITMEDLATITGIPLRSLHHSFRKTLGVTPMELLRDIRLRHVRASLLDPSEKDDVTTIALKWGFEHLGRFSHYYRRRFGELPKETIRRR
mgnify:CR=1 FL=1